MAASESEPEPTPAPAPATDGPAEAPERLLGASVGPYVIRRVIGRGGMGVVYEAHQERIGGRVAIKVLSARFSRDPEHARRFLTEAQAVGLVRHEGLVKIFDQGQLPDGTLYILMEHLEGESLRDRLRREGVLYVGDALRLARQVASALVAAHARGVVHRDLKPENVLVVPDGEAPGGERAKVVDFGVAKLLGPGGAATQPGQVLGTLTYLSPEGFLGAGDVDERTDVYSLGVMLYELLSGRPPFRKEDGDLPHQHLYDEPPPLSRHAAAVPAEVAALVHRMLAKDRALRPAMSEIIDRIRWLAAEPTAPEEGPGGAAAPAPRRDGETASESLPAASAAAPRAAAPPLREGAPRTPPEAPPGRELQPRRPSRRRRRLLRTALPALLAATLAAVAILSLRGAAPAGMAAVPGATFLMGSTATEVGAAFAFCRRLIGDKCVRALYEREQPQRQVTVSPFFLDETEVSNEAFAAWLNRRAGLTVRGLVVAAGGALYANLYPGYGYGGLVHEGGRFAARPGLERKPVVQVSWDAARAYCADLGRRLPTEAEWELAARGPRGMRFPWGDREPACDEVTFARVAGEACAGQPLGPGDVGTAPRDRSAAGARDLGGNVAEWVEDAFAERYAPCPAPCRDPVAAGPAEARVVRGGAWGRAAESLRGAGRGRRAPDQVSGDIGFRCAASVGAPAGRTTGR